MTGRIETIFVYTWRARKYLDILHNTRSCAGTVDLPHSTYSRRSRAFMTFNGEASEASNARIAWILRFVMLLALLL